jgi:hypothetical protein
VTRPINEPSVSRGRTGAKVLLGDADCVENGLDAQKGDSAYFYAKGEGAQRIKGLAGE